MKARITYLLLKIRESFWFVPIVMVLVSYALAHASLYADQHTAAGTLAKQFWFGALDEESARMILTTVSGAMITTASLVFSMTLVSITLASQQLGPRLLSMFLRDPMTQAVLGLFLATFVYALVLLMALGGDDGPVLVPMLSISVSVASTIASFVALIVFIHHLSTSLQADVVVSRVAAQLRSQIDEHCAHRCEDDPASPGNEPTPDIDGRRLDTTGGGYIQAIDFNALLAIAGEFDLQIQILHRPGHFVCEGQAIAVVSPTDRDPEQYCSGVHQAIVFGNKRTATQDLEFGLMAMVEIALRALSPGINDPHTANTCVDRLSESLAMMFKRTLRSNVHHDDSDRLRLVTNEVTIDGLVDTAFNEIRQCAANSVPVLIRLGEGLERLGACATTPAQTAAVRRHLEMLKRCADDHIREPGDRESIDTALQRAETALGDAPGA